METQEGMKPSVRQVLFQYLDSQPARLITGWELYEAIGSRTGKHTYPGTLLSYMRDYCAISGGELKCVDAKESRYSYVPGCKISGALDYGKE